MGFNKPTIHNLYESLGLKKVFASKPSDFGYPNNNKLLVLETKEAKRFMYCGMIRELALNNKEVPRYGKCLVFEKFKRMYMDRSNLTEMMEVLKAMFEKQTEKKINNLLTKVSKGVEFASDKVVNELIKEIKELKEVIRRNTIATEENTGATIENTKAVLPYEVKSKIDYNLEVRGLKLKTYEDVLRTIQAKDKSGISPGAWRDLVRVARECGFYNN
jgi:hypothetical protein